jgi:hypothetical protein
MKRSSIALILVMVVFGGLSVGQDTAVQKDGRKVSMQDWSASHRYFCWQNDGTGFWSAGPLAGPVYFCVGPYDRAPSSKPMTGKVSAADAERRSMSVTISRATGRGTVNETLNLSAAKLKKMPPVGSTVDLIESPRRWIYASCEECNSVCPGVCFMTSNMDCRCYLFHLRTK